MDPTGQSRNSALGVGLWVALLVLSTASGGVISVQDHGSGTDYLSGDAIVLPSAWLSTNQFSPGAQAIYNRPHVVRSATFEENGRLQLKREGFSDPSGLESPFPPYLKGQQYVWFAQDVRHYTNYNCVVTVDCPSTFYLLVDNRVNEFSLEKSYSDPSFGPPDTEWVLRDGWERVDTGLTPLITETNRGDYLGIDEGNNGSINQVYAIYKKSVFKPGAVVVRTQFEGNMYCLVVSTNMNLAAKLERPRGSLASETAEDRKVSNAPNAGATSIQ